MGTIVVGYVPKPEGDAALDRAIEEAKLRGDKLVVVNSHRGGREFDAGRRLQGRRRDDEVKAKLEGAGVDYDVRQLVRGFEPAEDLVNIAEATRPSSSSSACAAAHRSAS